MVRSKVDVGMGLVDRGNGRGGENNIVVIVVIVVQHILMGDRSSGGRYR